MQQRWAFTTAGSARFAENASYMTQNSRELACERAKRQFLLTDAEARVLPLLMEGHSRKAIAQRLYLSENTVGTHISNVYRKTSCHKRDDLIRLLEELAAEESEVPDSCPPSA